MAPSIGLSAFILFLASPWPLVCAERPAPVDFVLPVLNVGDGDAVQAGKDEPFTSASRPGDAGGFLIRAGGANSDSRHSSRHNIDGLKKRFATLILLPSAGTENALLSRLLVQWFPNDVTADWSSLLLFRISFGVPALLVIFAALLHKKLPNAPASTCEPARDGEPYVGGLLPVVTILALSVGTAYQDWDCVMAQAPLLFMLLGFGLAQTDTSRSATFAPLIGSYALMIFILSRHPEGRSLHSAQGMLRAVVPMDVVTEQRSDIVGDVSAAYGSALICVFLLPAVQRVTQHYASGHRSVVWMVFAVWLVAIFGLAIDLGLYACKLVSIFSFMFTSIVARSHLPSFSAGIIVAYCPPASRNVSTIFTGVMCAATYILLIAVESRGLLGISSGGCLFYMVERGLMLPLQAGMMWALDGGLPRASWLPSVSFAPIFLLPMSYLFTQSLAEGSVRWAAVLALGLAAWAVSFAIEMAVSKLASALFDDYAVPVSSEEGSPVESAPFLGEHTEPGNLNRLRSICLGSVYYLSLLSSVLAMSLFFWENKPSASFVSERRIEWYKFNSSVLAMILATLIAPWFLLNVSGHLLWPAPIRKAIPKMQELLATNLNIDKDSVLIFRYVTRGNNPTLMAANIKHSVEVLKLSGLPEHKWRLQVVTDRSMNLQGHVSSSVFETVVPDEYECPNGGLYKARALHFAVKNTQPTPKRSDWIIHLDEETLFDTHTVCACYQYAISENSKTSSGEQALPSIGQGVIVYNCYAQGLENHLTSLTDARRVADDFGMYQVCYKLLRRALCGMHGSFVVCAQSVEEDVGFDHGVEGSITEDAYFAMIASSRHDVKMNWIDAFMFEQSPFSTMDLIRQRGRWFHGLWYTSFTERIPLHTSCLLKYIVISWSLCWIYIFNWPLRVFEIVHPDVENILVIPRSLWQWNFILGFVMSYSPYREGWSMWFLLLALQMMAPSGLVEIGGLFWGMYLVLSKNVSFFVVQKEKDVDPTKTITAKHAQNDPSRIAVKNPSKRQTQRERVCDVAY